MPLDTIEFEPLAIEVPSQESRPFVFTNKQSAFFYGFTGSTFQDGHQGFYVRSQKYLADFSIAIDGQIIARKSAAQIKAYPDHISRIFNRDVVENLYFLENINCLVVEYSAPELHSYDFTPLFDGNFNPEAWEENWLKNQDLLLLTPKDKNSTAGFSHCIGICIDCSANYKSDARILMHYDLPARQIGVFRVAKDFFRIYILVAESESEIRNLAAQMPQSFETYVNARRQRMVKLLGDCHFETNLPDLNKAFRWALLSLDQLVMKQPVFNKKMTGIFAGLPWFCNYWGRDTFISLPGATLVTAQLQSAKEILLSFAQFQSTNPDSPDYGRIPNQITTDKIIYNTADATPWFVRELWEYYLYSGDFEILKNLFPVVKRAIDGTLKYHIDDNYFLTHGEAETWMDAQGPNGAWSPRGNRAVEIQALWFQQLLASANIADLVGESNMADEWRHIAKRLQQNFQRKFWNDKRMALFDHLDANDVPDTKIRPNQIFAMTIPEQPLINVERELMVAKDVVTKLTYPYGVASLWQHDTDFHPYHLYPPFYPKDAAYHNGTVWLWLTGPVVSSLMKYGYEDLAFELLHSETTQCLQLGAIGTLSELLNALPSEGQSVPTPSGTVTQAWSIGEYLRNIYQDLIGIKPDVPHQKIILEPHLPNAINSLACRIPLLQENLHLLLQRESQSYHISLNYLEGNRNWTVEIHFATAPGEKIIFNFPIQIGQERKVRIELTDPINLTIDDTPVGFRLERLQIPRELFNYISFAVPQLNKNLKCLRDVPYPRLSGRQIAAWNDHATKLIDKTGAEKDDRGANNRYTYPTSSLYQDGILDLTKFQMFEDQENFYFRLNFRNLVQPGWHPEYGFQLTFVAIAIDKQNGKTGEQEIPRNANYRLPNNMKYQRIIFVGGGLQIEDDQHQILAVYHPQPNDKPLGNIEKKEISFAIPRKFIGDFQKHWRLAILVGGQDDHGAGGIGEFRDVVQIGSEWQGGGGDFLTGNSNVYDALIIK